MQLGNFVWSALPHYPDSGKERSSITNSIFKACTWQIFIGLKLRRFEVYDKPSSWRVWICFLTRCCSNHLDYLVRQRQINVDYSTNWQFCFNSVFVATTPAFSVSLDHFKFLYPAAKTYLKIGALFIFRCQSNMGRSTFHSKISRYNHFSDKR